MGLMFFPPHVRKGIYIYRERAIRERGRLHKLARRESGDASRKKEKAWERYFAKAEEARVLVRDVRRKALKAACENLRRNPRDVWKWESRVMGVAIEKYGGCRYPVGETPGNG